MPTPTFESARLRLPDGAECVLGLHRPAAPPDWAILLLPAMGTSAAYYRPLAEALAAAGHAVLRADLRGVGMSSERAALGHRYGYREMLTEDLPTLCAALRQRVPGCRIAVAGHSLGAQLLCLALEHGLIRADAFVSIAAGTAWLRNWRGLDRLGYLAMMQAVALASRWLPWYPGELLGFGGNQPRPFMRDWLENARHGEYLPELIPHLSGYRGPRPPTLALSIDGDRIAPPAAESDLLSRLSTERITRQRLPAPPRCSRWRRHFAWARRPQVVVDAIDGWLRQQPMESAPPRAACLANGPDQASLPEVDRSLHSAAA